MSKMLWELKAPLAIAKAKEDIGLYGIFRYMRYYRMYIERYKWTYKDVDLTNRIENKLFWRGKVALVKDPAFGLVVAEITEEKQDPNGNLLKVSIEAENGFKKFNLEVGKDVVILYADETRFAPVLYIWAIANDILSVEDIITQQNNMLRKPILVTGEGAELDNAMTKITNILSGIQFMNLKPNSKDAGNIMTDRAMEVLNLQTGNAYKGKELWESRGHYEDLIKDYLGYSTVNNQKKERMIQAEVSESNSICDTFYKSSTKMREECTKQVLSVLGEELKLEKMLEQEKEVIENGEEKNMATTNGNNEQ